MEMKALPYSSVTLIPRYSTLRSRDEADVSCEFLGRRFRLPCVPANMQSVINQDIAHWLSENDYPYIFHRFDDTLSFVRRANNESWKLISISVGVKEADRELLKAVVEEGLRVDWVTIDVAMGHHVLVKEMIEFIKSLDFKSTWGDYISDSFAIKDGIVGPGRGLTSIPLSYHPKIIAGNVATPEAVRDLVAWRADCVKIGVSQGMACRTYNQTGFGLPMWTCVKNCAKRGGGTEDYRFMTFGNAGMSKTLERTEIRPSPIPLILDGGIRENGEIAKALVAARGVKALVMCGSLFAACVDAPGENVYKMSEFPDIGHKLAAKRYHGSASAHQKGSNRHVEGVQIEIPCNGLTIAQKMGEIKEALQSAVSYGGGTDLSCFKNVGWMEV